MRHLTTISRYTLPAAMVVFLAHEISQSTTFAGLWDVFLVIASVLTAVSVEFVGIQAGHAVDRAWQVGDTNRVILSLVALLAYTLLTFFILYSNPIMRLLPFVAMILYLLAPVVEGLEDKKAHQQAQEQVTTTWELEEATKDKALDRELKRLRLTNKQAVKLAEIEHRASLEPAQSKIEPALSQHKPAQAGYECEDCRKPFATVQALNAHGRWCVRQNGKVKDG